ncbi:MAG: hypothetical protein ABMA25_05155 [Ilumatobacteraceae bacterium]
MKRKLIIAASLATAGALAVAGTVMADDRDGRGMGMGMDGRGHRPFVGGIFVMVALAAAVGVGVWLLMRRRPTMALAGAGPVASTSFASPTASAETILAERLARSEVTPDEYRVSLAALRESASGATPVAPWSPVAPAPEATSTEGDSNS